MKTIAQQAMTQTERIAFALALRAVVLSSAVGMCVVTVNVIKRCVTKPSKRLSRFIGFNWKRSISIRGDSLLVANG